MHNNSVFNNSVNTNGSFMNANANYHAMLVSPNLKTLYDKKAPPPPYPGKIEQLPMETEQLESEPILSKIEGNISFDYSIFKGC